MKNIKEILKIQKLLWCTFFMYTYIIYEISMYDVKMTMPFIIIFVIMIVYETYILNKRFNESKKKSLKCYENIITLYSERFCVIHRLFFALISICFVLMNCITC